MLRNVLLFLLLPGICLATELGDVEIKTRYDNWSVSDPSYCLGYVDIKIIQHPGMQYYKWMKEFYSERVSSTDLMAEAIDTRSYYLGYNMLDDKLTVECVYTFEQVLNGE